VKLPLGAAALTGIQVGAALVASQAVVADVGAGRLGFLRYAIALLFLLPLVRRRSSPPISRRDLVPVALIGLGMAAAATLTGAVCSTLYRPYLQRYGVVKVSALALAASLLPLGVAGLIEPATRPLLFLAQAMTPALVAAIGCVVAGLALMALPGRTRASAPNP